MTRKQADHTLVFVLSLIVATLCSETLSMAQDEFCALVVPGQVFCDDFSDGDATDGIPGTWSLRYGGTQTVEDGSLIITQSTPNFPASELTLPATNYSDVSLRTQVRVLQGQQIGVGVRDSRGTASRGNYGGGIGNGMAALGIGGSDNEMLAEVPLDFDAYDSDAVIQLDAIGDTISLWVWPADHAMPAEPTIRVVNNEVQTGGVLIWAGQGNSVDPVASGAFRYVRVATQSIPEPSSVLLTGFGLLGLSVLGRRRSQVGKRLRSLV